MTKGSVRVLLLASALIAASHLAAGSAAAAVLGVTEIRVYSSAPTWEQIAELIAIQSGTGINVALASNGASAAATSSYPGTAPANAIDGVYPAGFPNIWHSGSANAGEYLQVLLASPFNLSSVTIYGRTDYGGNERDLYDLFLYDATGHLLADAFGADARTAGFVTVDFSSRATVLEPGSIGIVAAGAALLGWVRRRRVSRMIAS